MKKNLAPALSVLCIILSLLTLAFLRLKERTLGYEVLQARQEFKESLDQKRQLEVTLARSRRPQHLDQVAQGRLTLQKISRERIIHLSGTQVAGAEPSR